MKKIIYFFFIGFILINLYSCFFADRGELTGRWTTRLNYAIVDPAGMQLVPAGSFTMGANDQDVPYAGMTDMKTITMSPFWIDETEITNNEYRQFTHWVRDSIIRKESMIEEPLRWGWTNDPERNWNSAELEDEQARMDEWYIDWNKKLNTITIMTLNTVDSSRVLEIDPNRLAKPSDVRMNTVFSSWRTKRPDFSINDVNYKKRVSINKEEKYKPFSKLRHISTFLLPDYDESLIYNGAFSDVMGRHLFAAAVITDYDTLNSIFFQYQNSTGVPIDAFWGLNIYQDANFQLQFYNKDKSYLETFNGVSIWAKVPYNFGKSLSDNHVFSSSLQLVKREQFFKS